MLPGATSRKFNNKPDSSKKQETLESEETDKVAKELLIEQEEESWTFYTSTFRIS